MYSDMNNVRADVSLEQYGGCPYDFIMRKKYVGECLREDGNRYRRGA